MGGAGDVRRGCGPRPQHLVGDEREPRRGLLPGHDDPAVVPVAHSGADASAGRPHRRHAPGPGRVAGRPGHAACLRPQRWRAASGPPDALGRRGRRRGPPRLPVHADQRLANGHPDSAATRRRRQLRHRRLPRHVSQPSGAPTGGPCRGGLRAPHPGHHHPLVVGGSHLAHGRRSPHRRQVPQHGHRVGHVRRTHARHPGHAYRRVAHPGGGRPGSDDRDARTRAARAGHH